jgi:hypothetical protein
MVKRNDPALARDEDGAGKNAPAKSGGASPSDPSASDKKSAVSRPEGQLPDEAKPTSLLDAALAFAAREYPVFPCKNMPADPPQHKAPLTKNGFKDATTDPVQIKRWWTRYPDALIGIPTGAVSRFAVLDLDKKNGKNGFLHVPDWREISPFIVETGSGGAHLYFRDDERLYTVTNALGLSGVDIKAKGGYIIAPPSPGYTVIKGDFWKALPKWPEHLIPPERQLNAKPGTQPQAHIDDVRDALAVIPNDDDTSWDTWKVKVGMPTWAATGGSAEGFEAFRAWSEKSGKHDPHETEKAWAQISHSPPDSVGFGSLFHMAREADPEWEMRWRQRQDDRWRVTEAQIEAELAAASAAVTPELIDGHLAWVREAEAQRIAISPASVEAASTDAPRDNDNRESGERPKPAAEKVDEKKSGVIRAKPFKWRDPATLPRRQWLYKPFYIARYLSVTGGATAVAKSSLVIVEALAMASGRALLGVRPERKLNVWLWNGEDPEDELERRIGAAMKYYDIKPDEVEGKLLVNSGRDTEIIIAREGENRTPTLNAAVYGQLVSEIRALKVDVLFIDPLVNAHKVSENDNMAMELVAKSFARIADEANCSVMFVHHAKKTYGEDANTDDLRGASALAAAARDVRTVNFMNKGDAEKAGISEADRKLHLRLDRGKSNLTRPPESADWFKLESVDLGNKGSGEHEPSDLIGIVRSWKFEPSSKVEMTPTLFAKCIDAIRAGGPWRADARAENEVWVGVPIASVLNLNIGQTQDKSKVTRIIGDWLTKGVLKTETGRDPSRKLRTYLKLGNVTATVDEGEPL